MWSSISPWFYMVIACLLYIGIKYWLANFIFIARLLILPVVYLIILSENVSTIYTLELGGLLLIFLGFITGALLGWLCAHIFNKKLTKNGGVFKISTDFFILTVGLIVFLINYMIKYSLANEWSIINFAWFYPGIEVACGLTIGATIAASITYFRMYFKQGQPIF